MAALSATTRALYDTAPMVLLHVVETNHAALALYERLAFERTRRMYLVRFVR
jgi:ribosomal protein S18 acetylase RimI-like enzyme